MQHDPHHELQFALLSKLPFKELKAFREDAGWQEAPPPPKNARGKVQWAVACIGTRRVAIARLEEAPPEFCFVSELIVSSKHRSHGVGSWLLQCIEQHCLKQGIRRIILQPSEGTRDFYHSRHFTDDPLVPTCMKKEISPLARRRFIP